MDKIEKQIKKKFADVIIYCISLNFPDACEKPTVDEIIEKVSYHKNPKQGDYQFNIRFLYRYKGLLPKSSKTKPDQVNKLVDGWVSELNKRLIGKNSLIEEVSANLGFITIKLNNQNIIKTVISQVVEEREQYGFQKEKQGDPIIIEYSSPNIAKPFHVGHLRSTIIGNFLKNLHNAHGYKTKSINYLGDWGKQYGLLAIAFKKWGSEVSLQEDPIGHLYELYVKINKALKEERKALGENRTPLDQGAQEYFSSMENGNKVALVLWKCLRDLSIRNYEKIYDRLGVRFDEYSGESGVSYTGVGTLLDKVDNILTSMVLLQTDDEKEVKYVDLEEYKLGRATIYKSDGTTLYLTRDLAEVQRRWELNKFSKSLYVVGDPQKYHFRQLFKVLELMDTPYHQYCQHVGFGKVIGMSTREGNAILLKEILDKVQNKMLSVMKENPEKMKNVADPNWTADQLGISAIVIQDFSAKRGEDYHFDLDRMSSFKGETGPYLQYAHARIESIFRKADTELNTNADLRLLTEQECYLLVKEIGKYPMILNKCLETLEPIYLVSYLMDLSKAIALAHKILQVKGAEKSLAEARLLLFWTAKTTLASGLKILGLNPIEAM